MDIKMAAARTIDYLMTPITLAGGYWLMRARRFGLHNLPHTKKLLLDIGMMPIRDHYYEPLFRKSQLRKPLDALHGLPGIEMDDAAQLSFLESFDYTDELDEIPVDREGTGMSYYYMNPNFGVGDGEMLYNVIRKFGPSTVVEIGSGYSTLMAEIAINRNGGVRMKRQNISASNRMRCRGSKSAA